MKGKYKTLGTIIVFQLLVLYLLNEFEIATNGLIVDLVAVVFFFTTSAMQIWIANVVAALCFVLPITYLFRCVANDQNFSATVRKTTEFLMYFLAACTVVGAVLTFPAA